MAARRRRGKPPIQDAIEHAIKAQDKIAELEVKYINSFKGLCVHSGSTIRTSHLQMAGR